MNQLFKEFGGNNQNTNPIINKFLWFKQNFKGDAKSQVEQLLASGRVSKQQYDDAVMLTNQLQQLFK